MGSPPRTDDEIRTLVAAAASELATDEYSLLSWLGRRAFRELAALYDDLVSGYRSTRALLGDLDTVIHREVERLYPEAHSPRFAIEERAGQLLVHYASDRGLVAFAIGMIHGAAAHFGEEFTIERVDDGRDPTSACLRLTPVAVEQPGDSWRPAA
jgi:hypothetical protein